MHAILKQIGTTQDSSCSTGDVGMVHSDATFYNEGIHPGCPPAWLEESGTTAPEVVLSADWKVVGSLVLGSALAVSWGDAGVAGALGGGAERGVLYMTETSSVGRTIPTHPASLSI